MQSPERGDMEDYASLFEAPIAPPVYDPAHLVWKYISDVGFTDSGLY